MLWAEFRQGDRLAYSQLIKQLYRPLYQYGCRLDVRRDLVKDCIHDLFVDLWEHRATLSEAQSVRFYVLSPLRRRIFRDKKKNKWFTEANEIQDEHGFDLELTVENQLIKWQDDCQASSRLQVVMSRLTKRQYEAIHLRFFQQLAYMDVAAILGINYRSTVNLFFSALQQLRRDW